MWGSGGVRIGEGVGEGWSGDRGRCGGVVEWGWGKVWESGGVRMGEGVGEWWSGDRERCGGGEEWG